MNLKNKLKQILEKYIKPFFFSSDHPDRIKPIKFFITFFECLIASSIILKLDNPNWLSDTLILGLMGSLGMLLTADTLKSNSDNKYKNNTQYIGEKKQTPEQLD